jgi:hypothetical protein
VEGIIRVGTTLLISGAAACDVQGHPRCVRVPLFHRPREHEDSGQGACTGRAHIRMAYAYTHGPYARAMAASAQTETRTGLLNF